MTVVISGRLSAVCVPCVFLSVIFLMQIGVRHSRLVIGGVLWDLVGDWLKITSTWHIKSQDGGSWPGQQAFLILLLSQPATLFLLL